MKKFSINELNTQQKFKDILNRLVELLKDCENVKAIIVFGSIAKGTSTDKSDVDICIFSDVSEDEIWDIAEINEAVLKIKKESLYTSFDILTYYSEDDLKNCCNMYQCVEKDIINDGIEIYKRADK